MQILLKKKDVLNSNHQIYFVILGNGQKTTQTFFSLSGSESEGRREAI